MTPSVRRLDGPTIHALREAERVGSFCFRDEDTAECILGGMSPMDAVEFSAKNSLESFAVGLDGELLCVWGYGVRNRLNGIGYPWLLSTGLVNKHQLFFARTSQHAVGFLLRKFIRLEILVDARYLRAQRWLIWLGFKQHNACINGFLHMAKDR